MIIEGCFTWVEGQGSEADHSLPRNAEVKNDGAVRYSMCLHGVIIKKSG
jgi:hypothetical protein